MVRLAIRDDDTNYFTKPEDLESVYADFGNFPITFAVIPTVTDAVCPETNGNTEPQWIGDNATLITYLKDRLQKRTCDVIMHGITHQYGPYGEPEMVWRNDDPELSNALKYWKQRLEETFNYPITCFSSPSGQILKNGVNAVTACGMNLSDVIHQSFERDKTLRNYAMYGKRWMCRLLYGIPYPGVLYYSDHTEIIANTLHDIDYSVKVFNFCDRHNLPMVLNVHYWQLRDREGELGQLKSFVIDYALRHGAEPCTISHILQRYKGNCSI